MRRAALSVAAILLFCVPVWAAGPSRDLLAHGGDEQFWIARVVPKGPGNPFESTNLMYRENFGGPWTPLEGLSSRVVSMASSQGEALLVLKDGQWMIANETDIRLGPPPPNLGKMIAIASEGSTVWGVVTDQGPTTRLSDGAATRVAATEEGITTPVLRWFVYQFSQGQWINPKKMPVKEGGDFDSLSMAVVNGLPVIAWRGTGGKILISRMEADGTWHDPIVFTPPAESGDFKLLSAEGQAVLWTSAPTHAPQNELGGQLHEGDDFSKGITLAVTGTMPPPGQPQTIALFKERWRWLTSTENEFYEQAYEMDGKVAPDFVPATGGGAEDEGGPQFPLAPFVAGAGTVVLIAGVAAVMQRRNRGIPPAVPPEQVLDRIAPLGVRTAAALIDLVPALAALWAIPRPLSVRPTPEDMTSFGIIALVGLAAYVGHTLVSELICGQTVGKMMFGLRVAGSFGGKPPVMGIIARNLLRVADLCPVVSLTAVILSPRWQRVGDLIGRTVVIVDEEEPKDSAE